MTINNNASLVLATDLDGTFLGGTSSSREQLYSLLRNNSNVCLIFVTGRGRESVQELFSDPNLPRPDFIIGDVGASIFKGDGIQPVEPLQSNIDALWPGDDEIQKLIEHLPGLTLQEVPLNNRRSYFVEDLSIVEAVRNQLKDLQCEVIYSANRFLDILPRGVNKGSTLTLLVNHLGQDRSDVLVAGDTLNDLSLFQTKFKGVAVGNSEPELLEAVADYPSTYIASDSGAGGILEALSHFGTVSKN